MVIFLGKQHPSYIVHGGGLVSYDEARNLLLISSLIKD